MVKITTQLSVNKLFMEADTGKSKHNGKDLCQESRIARCNGILAYCELSEEDGGYKYQGSKLEMQNKVGKLLLELKEDAQTRQTDKESIVTETMIKDQEFIIHQAKELLKTMKKVIECNKIIRRKARQLKTYNTKQQGEVRKFYKI